MTDCVKKTTKRMQPPDGSHWSDSVDDLCGTCCSQSPYICRWSSTLSLQCFQASSSGFMGASMPAMQASRARVASKAAPSPVRAEIGDTLEEFLVKATPNPKLRQMMQSLGEALRTIAFKVRTASCSQISCTNTFGDEQLAVDVLADKLMFEACRYSGVCLSACSEEVPEIVKMGSGEDGFSVAFDPLDGSSIVDTNFTVGTIFGVWPGSKLTGIKGSQLAASGMGVYGPRTTYVLSIAGFPGTHEFLLIDEGKWIHVKETTEIKEGKLFSPGNLRATFDNPNYEKLVSYWIGEKYTLRYTGGMVPDVGQIIVKEKGVFCNASSPSTKTKLRMVFEVAPLAYLIEKAGGYSSNGTMSILDIPINTVNDVSQVCYGSKNEVRRFEEYIVGASRIPAESA
eukprot:jgi/Mesvir1/19921/Mv13191-RA.2